MKARFQLVWLWAVMNILLGLVACNKKDAQENQVASEYSFSVSPENPSILEEFSLTFQGPPARSVSLEVTGPEGAGGVSCQDSAQSATNGNAGVRKYSCLFLVAGLYKFTAKIETFSGEIKTFSSEVQVGNAQRFALRVTQGSSSMMFRSNSATSEGEVNLLTEAPVNFKFEDGGESAKVTFSDGASYNGPEFSHTFNQGGPQAFKVEMRNGAGEVRMNRDYTVVVRCNGNTAPPVVISRIDVSLQSNGSYRYTPVASSGTIAGFKLDANGDRTLDTPWVRESYRDEYSLLTGDDRPVGVLAMNRCGDVSAYSAVRVIPLINPGSGQSHIKAELSGLEGNNEPSANVMEYMAVSAQGTIGPRRYRLSMVKEPNNAGGFALSIDSEQNEYLALTDDDRHGYHLRFPLAANLIPSGAGNTTGTTQLAIGQMMYQTAKEGDTIVGRVYRNPAPITLNLAVEKTLVEGGDCSPSGNSRKQYEIKVTGTWDWSPLEESVTSGVAKKLRSRGTFVYYEGQTQNEVCTPAPRCFLQSSGSYVSGSFYNSQIYRDVVAGVRLSTSGDVSSITFQGAAASEGMQFLTPTAVGRMTVSATVSGAGGSGSCSTEIEVHEKPGTTCSVSVGNVVAVAGATARAYLSIQHLPLHGGSLTSATMNGLPLQPGNYVDIPVTGVGPFTVNASYTTSSGASSSCSGGGEGLAIPGPGCTRIQGSGTVYLNQPSSYYLEVTNAQYHGNTWTGTLGGELITSSANNKNIAWTSTGNKTLTASITMADGSTADCPAKPVNVIPIPAPECQLYFTSSPIYQGVPIDIVMSTTYEGLNGGVTTARIDGQTVTSTMRRTLTFNTLGGITVNGELTTANGITVTCSRPGTVVAVPPPPALACDVSAAPGTLAINQNTTLTISVYNLQHHGGSLTAASIEGQAVSLTALSRQMSWSSAGTKNFSASITSSSGASASCTGAKAVVPDTPPPPTSTCTVSVELASGGTAPNPTIIDPTVTLRVRLQVQNGNGGSITTPNGTTNFSGSGSGNVTVSAGAFPVGQYTFQGTSSGAGGNNTCEYRMNFIPET